MELISRTNCLSQSEAVDGDALEASPLRLLQLADEVPEIPLMRFRVI